MKIFTLLTLALLFINCGNKNDFDPEWLNEKSPQIFNAKFETTKGNFEIKVHRNWSPLAADRFYQLIKNGYFTDSFFYRVVPDFVAQFGSLDMKKRNPWLNYKIPDEPVIQKNRKGTISFARLGKDSRDLELFINLRDNSVLDTLNYEKVVGFPAIGEITNGMETVELLYSKYGEKTMSDADLYRDPSTFYSKFPKLDLIKKAYIIDN